MLMLWFVDSSRNVPWYFHYAFIDENRRIWRWGNGFPVSHCTLTTGPVGMCIVGFHLLISEEKYVVRQNYCYRTVNARNAKKAYWSGHLHDELITMIEIKRCAGVQIQLYRPVFEKTYLMYFSGFKNHHFSCFFEMAQQKVVTSR